MPIQIDIDRDRIAAFCRKWRITEFSLFGSVVRGDFGPDSDVDVLVSWPESAEWTLFDMVTMEEELEELFGREVDLLTRRGVEGSLNWMRRANILSSVTPIYAA